MESSKKDTSSEAYTPHLKRVLKSYQAAAISSLHGPDRFAWRHKDVSAPEGKNSSGQNDSEPSIVIPGRIAIQQPPLLIPPDQSICERSETILEGESISCFNIGGEDRLCLPQILTTVLRDISLQQINSVCGDLQIFCASCNDDQLEVLKNANIIPSGAPSCGLITKTDAERLCATLLHGAPLAPAGHKDVPHKSLRRIQVYHECFGGCVGELFSDLYTSQSSRCVRCSECFVMLTLLRFVSHVHRHRSENRTCHWGFDSTKWRHYVLLCEGLSEDMQTLLDEVKAKFDNKRKQRAESASPVRNGEESGEVKKKARSRIEPVSPPTSTAPVAFNPYMAAAMGWDPTMWVQWAAKNAAYSWLPRLPIPALGVPSTVHSKSRTNNNSGSSGQNLMPQMVKSSLQSSPAKWTLKYCSSKGDDSVATIPVKSTGDKDAVAKVEEPVISKELTALQKLMEEDGVSQKAQRHILEETQKVIANYQHLIKTLAQQNRNLQKELAVKQEKASPVEEAKDSPLEVKQEPIEDCEPEATGGPNNFYQNGPSVTDCKRSLIAT